MSFQRRSYTESGHAHELTFSCCHGLPLLAKERTCEWLAESINAARLIHECAIWAYVFMPNHVHLVVHFRNPVYDLSGFRADVKSPVSRKALAYLREYAPNWLPRLEQRRGKKVEHHFWQRGGGYDRNITEPKTLERMIEYTHLNPVRKGLVINVTDWRWSSAGWYAGQIPNTLPIDRLPAEWAIGMSGT